MRNSFFYPLVTVFTIGIGIGTSVPIASSVMWFLGLLAVALGVVWWRGGGF